MSHRKFPKPLAYLMIMAILMSLFTFAPMASAADLEYAKISGSYAYVDDEEGQDAGVIKVVYGEDYDSADVSTIYVEVTLPDDVEFTDVSTVTYGGWTREGDSDTSLTVSNTSFAALTIGNIKLDIDSGFTGNVVADVRVWAEKDGAVVWDVSSDVTIAKIKSGDVTVTAKSAKTLQVGSGKEGAKITIKEQNPGALTAGSESDTDNDIFLTIKTSGVEWDVDDVAANISTVGVAVYTPGSDNLSNDNKTLRLDVKTATSVLNGRIEITPYFKVKPSASGDVVVKVSGDDVPTTEVTVGVIGGGAVDITVDNADDDVAYLGQKNSFDDVEITLDPTTDLDDEDYITITLPKGLKWQDPDDGAPAAVDNSDVEISGLYDDDRSLWLTIADTVSDEFTISDLVILADYDAPVGDLEVTFGGSADGTAKIGTVKAPFTITADTVNFPLRGSDVQGGKIVITEVSDGALVETDGNDQKDDGVPGYLDIVLPIGVTFARTPDVDVVDGDLEIGNVSVEDDNTLRIEIDGESNLASTIEITDLYYDVDNRATAGDVVAKVGKDYNLQSSNYLATVKLGSIVDSSQVTASFKIGDEGVVAMNGRTLVQVNKLCDVLGLQKSWDAATSTAYFVKSGTVVAFPIGKNQIVINGNAIAVDQGGVGLNGATFATLRGIQMAFGGELNWDQATQTATFNFTK